MKKTLTAAALLISAAAAAQISVDVGLSSHGLNPTARVGYEHHLSSLPLILETGSRFIANGLLLPYAGGGYVAETEKATWKFSAYGVFTQQLSTEKSQIAVQQLTAGAEVRVEVNQGTAAISYQGNGLFCLTVGFIFKSHRP